MKQEINEKDLESVVGGLVAINGNKMLVRFTTLGRTFRLRNCEGAEANILASQIYLQYRNEGDVAFETAVMDAFRANGWIN